MILWKFVLRSHQTLISQTSNNKTEYNHRGTQWTVVINEELWLNAAPLQMITLLFQSYRWTWSVYVKQPNICGKRRVRFEQNPNETRQIQRERRVGSQLPWRWMSRRFTSALHRLKQWLTWDSSLIQKTTLSARYSANDHTVNMVLFLKAFHSLLQVFSTYQTQSWPYC